MAISAREIVRSVGMSDKPEYYSGRGARISDLPAKKLVLIYNIIKERIGAKQAETFVTMIKSLKTLSATNFLNSLYLLEANNWVYRSAYKSNIDVGPDGPGRNAIAFATVVFGSSEYDDGDTDYIRNQFLCQIGR